MLEPVDACGASAFPGRVAEGTAAAVGLAECVGTTSTDPHCAPSSAGADTTKAIEDLGKRLKVKVLGVSMGQGQEVRALSTESKGCALSAAAWTSMPSI